jgi:hypothetical protein
MEVKEMAMVVKEMAMVKREEDVEGEEVVKKMEVEGEVNISLCEDRDKLFRRRNCSLLTKIVWQLNAVALLCR